jgi:hypothetical protein
MKYLILLSLVLSSSAFSGMVYKYTDAKGNISYSDREPNHGENAESIDIPQPANQFDSQSGNHKAANEQLDATLAQEAKDSANAESTANYQQAMQQRLKDAEQALEDSRTIRAGDMLPLPNGATRHSDAYKSRINSAQEQVDQARKALSEANAQ